MCGSSKLPGYASLELSHSARRQFWCRRTDALPVEKCQRPFVLGGREVPYSGQRCTENVYCLLTGMIDFLVLAVRMGAEGVAGTVGVGLAGTVFEAT